MTEGQTLIVRPSVIAFLSVSVTPADTMPHTETS